MKKNRLVVQETLISIRQHEKDDFISLTDIDRYKDRNRSDYILQNWMGNRETIEFLGLWEKINNEDFNSIEFDGIKNKSGVNSFILIPKQWINSTNATKEHLIPNILSKPKDGFLYANEADVLNMALFGLTAKQWRENNPKQEGNIRDYARIEQLVVLSNMESVNAELIKQGMIQTDKLVVLNSMAISQMKSLVNNPTIKKLGK